MKASTRRSSTQRHGAACSSSSSGIDEAEPTSATPTALLRGLLRCANCDAAMVHTFTAKGRKRYRYYVCSAAKRHGWDTCPSKSLPAGEIEEFVVERVRTLGDDPVLLRETLEAARIQGREDRTDLGRERTLLERELRTTEADSATLLRDSGADLDPSSSNAARLADLQARITTLEGRLREIRAELSSARDQQPTMQSSRRRCT